MISKKQLEFEINAAKADELDSYLKWKIGNNLIRYLRDTIDENYKSITKTEIPFWSGDEEKHITGPFTPEMSAEVNSCRYLLDLFNQWKDEISEIIKEIRLQLGEGEPFKENDKIYYSDEIGTVDRILSKFSKKKAEQVRNKTNEIDERNRIIEEDSSQVQTARLQGVVQAFDIILKSIDDKLSELKQMYDEYSKKRESLLPTSQDYVDLRIFLIVVKNCIEKMEKIRVDKIEELNECKIKLDNIEQPESQGMGSY